MDGDLFVEVWPQALNAGVTYYCPLFWFVIIGTEELRDLSVWQGLNGPSPCPCSVYTMCVVAFDSAVFIDL